MIVHMLRKNALPALIGSVLALSIALPSFAYADEEPQTAMNIQQEEVDSQAQEQLSTSILSSCDSMFRQAQSTLLLNEAMSLEGSPYAYGGTTPRGFDCSGFTKYCFRNALGIDLPRTAAAQAALGESVSMDELQPGDLLFWGSGSGVYHVGIYVGDDTYIHAAGSGKGVRVQTMDYFHPTFAKRII